MEEKQPKKQFSLSLTVRICLALLITVSVAVFAADLMRYNQLIRKREKLEAQILQLQQDKEDLTELLNSRDELQSGIDRYGESSGGEQTATDREKIRRYILNLLRYGWGNGSSDGNQ